MAIYDSNGNRVEGEEVAPPAVSDFADFLGKSYSMNVPSMLEGN